jgi:hypothetical protein
MQGFFQCEGLTMIKRKKVSEMNDLELNRAVAEVTGNTTAYKNWLVRQGVEDSEKNFAIWADSFGWFPTASYAIVGHFLDDYDITLSVAREYEDGTRDYLAEAWGNLRKGTSIRARGMGKTRLEAICRCVVIVHVGNDC